jgi:hypothetical protein
MAYERFTRTAIRVVEPAMSFAPAGRIVLNAAATRIISEAGIRAVLLLWDRENRKIAFKATTRADRDGFAISKAGSSGGLRAKSFLSHIGWIPTERQTLIAVWNQKERMFEVSLPPKGQEDGRASALSAVGKRNR